MNKLLKILCTSLFKDSFKRIFYTKRLSNIFKGFSEAQNKKNFCKNLNKF